MGSYVQLQFDDVSSSKSEQLIAALNEAGYEGFEEGENILKAFISSHDFDETASRQIAESLQVNFSKTIIEETNWNQVWESNFQPVIVDEFVGIRASFHDPLNTVPVEL